MALTIYALILLSLIFEISTSFTSSPPPLISQISPLPRAPILQRQDVLQDVVTWDHSSIMVRGERIMFLSAEFHPWRLPSPGLWLDIFQKVKALGFSGVSFYLNWALLEGEEG